MLRFDYSIQENKTVNITLVEYLENGVALSGRIVLNELTFNSLKEILEDSINHTSQEPPQYVFINKNGTT